MFSLCVGRRGTKMAASYPNFDPNKRKGSLARVAHFINENTLKEMQELLFNDQIEKNIPPEYRKNIRWIMLNPEDIVPENDGVIDSNNNRGIIGWEYVPQEDTNL